MCRRCKFYEPDERFKGVIGWCKKRNKATGVTDNCDDQEDGTQHYMCGEEVKE